MARGQQKHAEIPLTFHAFDVLSVKGRDSRTQSVGGSSRLGLDGPRWRVPEAFDAGWGYGRRSASTSLRRGREAAARALPLRRAPLGKGEESRLLAVRARARGRDSKP
jgi:hypothetical protein